MVLAVCEAVGGCSAPHGTTARHRTGRLLGTGRDGAGPPPWTTSGRVRFASGPAAAFNKCTFIYKEGRDGGTASRGRGRGDPAGGGRGDRAGRSEERRVGKGGKSRVVGA